MSSDKTSFQPYPPHKILTIILLEHHYTLVYSFQSLNNANRRECGRNKRKMFSRTLLKGVIRACRTERCEVHSGVGVITQLTLSTNIAKLSRWLGNKSRRCRLWASWTPPPKSARRRRWRRHLHRSLAFLWLLLCVVSFFGNFFIAK